MHIQEKYILNFVTLLKATMGLTWQIMPIIIIRKDILNLSSISRISALEKYKNEKKKKEKKKKTKLK